MDEPVTADIGDRLRDARVRRGMSLRDAAERTKLTIAVLQAIERNDFARLPDGMYRKAYVRSLAREVGLDPREMAAAYDRQFPPAADPATTAGGDVFRREDEWARQLAPRRPSLITLLILLILAARWFAVADRVEPSDPLTDVIADPATVQVPIAAAAAVIPDETTPLVDAGVPPHVDAPLQVEISAVGWCWVAAESDGARVLYRMVAPGERIVIDGRSLISLRLGDAGSVRVSFNGGEARQLGGDGEVVDFDVTPATVGDHRAVA